MRSCVINVDGWSLRAVSGVSVAIITTATTDRAVYAYAHAYVTIWLLSFIIPSWSDSDTASSGLVFNSLMRSAVVFPGSKSQIRDRRTRS